MKQQKRNTIFAGVSFLETDQCFLLGVSCFEKRNTEAPSPVSSASSAGRGLAFRIRSSMGGGCLLVYKMIKISEAAKEVGIHNTSASKPRNWQNRRRPYGVVGGNVDICLRSGVKSGKFGNSVSDFVVSFQE